jgi:hypothetical protein
MNSHKSARQQRTSQDSKLTIANLKCMHWPSKVNEAHKYVILPIKALALKITVLSE